VIEATVEDGIATIRLNDPARRNALSTAMLEQFIAAFESLASSVRAVVLRAGPNDSVWCAGFDISELVPGFDPLAPGTPLTRAFRCVHDCPAPVIAMLHGSAWGGGCDLALRCDIAIGDPTASLAFTPAKLGLPYDFDGLRRAAVRAGLNVAMEMFATGAPIAAERALAVGLLNHLVPETELVEFTYAMARQIAANAPLSVTAAKRQLQALHDAMPLPVAQPVRAQALASEDFQEGKAAFLARRSPVFRGC
jgi:methylmalonyl-CoA decarboxylase